VSSASFVSRSSCVASATLVNIKNFTFKKIENENMKKYIPHSFGTTHAPVVGCLAL
jgi:hypothetical protein